jgi:hypothetical protein
MKDKIKPFRVNWSDKRTAQWKSYVMAELALKGKTLTTYVIEQLDKLAQDYINKEASNKG